MQQVFSRKLACLAKEIALTLHVWALPLRLPKDSQVWLTKPRSVYYILCMFSWKQRSCVTGTISHHLSIMGNLIYNRALEVTNFSYWNYLARSMSDLRWRCLCMRGSQLQRLMLTYLTVRNEKQVCISRFGVKPRTSQIMALLIKGLKINQPISFIAIAHLKVSYPDTF